MTGYRKPASTPWHASSACLARFVSDLIAEELRRLRPGRGAAPSQPWSEDLFLDERGLGLDSLELLTVAATLTEALHLHESGIEDQLLAQRRWGEWLQTVEHGLRMFDSVLTFRTSGSTGVPKPCSHLLALLHQEIDHLETVFAGTERVLTAVPSHHIYGFLFAILLPTRLKCTEVIDVRRTTPQVLQQLLRSGDLLVSHPAHWAVFARHADLFPSGVVGVTSGAPCAPELAETLAAAGMRRFVQVYGSTETGGVGWRDGSGDPYELMPFWSRDSAAEGNLRRTVPDGSTQAYPLKDVLEWQTSRTFFIRGRLDDAVQVGGINVFPARVRQTLLDHPQVADAAVRLMNPIEGSRLKAFVVPTADASWPALRAELERWVQSRLAAEERPRSFTAGSRLPMSDRSKLIDWPAASSLTAGS
jgi:4-coumarate--CoA ligase (photoactive yellow protein activation family)